MILHENRLTADDSHEILCLICFLKSGRLLQIIGGALRVKTLFRPVEFSIKLHTIKSGWSIVYIEGSQVIISKKILYFFL